MKYAKQVTVSARSLKKEIQSFRLNPLVIQALERHARTHDTTKSQLVEDFLCQNLGVNLDGKVKVSR